MGGSCPTVPPSSYAIFGYCGADVVKNIGQFSQLLIFLSAEARIFLLVDSGMESSLMEKL